MPTKTTSAPVAPPPELAKAMARSKAARTQWDALAPSHQKEYARWITDAKKDETRERRVAQAVEKLAEGRKTPMRANDAPVVSGAPIGKKLGVKPGHKVVVLDAPDGYAARVVDSSPVATRGKGDVVLAFARDSKGLSKVAPKAFASVAEGGLLWIAYPKKTSGIATDLSRDHGWDVVTKAGWQGVSLVAVDDAWSAMRFRPA
jgi:hypothetical protein